MKNYSSSIRGLLRFARPLSSTAKTGLFRTAFPYAIAAVLLGASAQRAGAQVVYDETISGDFSNSGLTPTFVSLQPGVNQIFGSTGRTTVMDRDYFTVTVPLGYTLSSLFELPGTQVGAAVSFIGLQAGNQVTLPTNTATAAGLLGWTHYGSGSAVASDLLPLMAIPSNGSSGFTLPLGSGNYSFWVQDFNAGTFNYGFDLRVTSAVPEPSSYAAIGGGLLLLVALRRFVAKRAGS